MTKARAASRPRLRLLPTVLLTAAILGLPTAVYAWGRTSSAFVVEDIVVAGTAIVPERQVERLLRRDYLGRNLFTVTAKDVRGTLAPLPYVAAVRVDRDFPGTLRVAVVEHVPAAYGLAAGRWFVVDRRGHVVCRVGDAGPAADGGTGAADQLAAGPPHAALDLPRLALPDSVTAGDDVQDAALDAELRVLAALPSQLAARVDVVECDGTQIRLRLADGPLVRWGDAGRSYAKGIALRAVLARYASLGRVCTWMDVSVPDRVLARPVLQ